MFLITGWNIWNPIPRECVLNELPGPGPAVFYHRLTWDYSSIRTLQAGLILFAPQ